MLNIVAVLIFLQQNGAFNFLGIIYRRLLGQPVHRNEQEPQVSFYYKNLESVHSTDHCE